MKQHELTKRAMEALQGNQIAPTVFTIMGPNGYGKSRLLRQVKEELETARVNAVLIPPARPLGSWSEEDRDQAELIPLDLPTEDIPQLLLSNSIARPGGKRPREFTLTFAYSAMGTRAIQSDLKAEKDFQKQALAYAKEKTGSEPKLASSKLKSLERHIKAVLGYDATIVQNSGIVDVQLRSDSAEFPLGGLSDGERQILLASILLLKENSEPFVILVDEPELHLNDARAVELWERVEKNFPNAVFVYATHSVAFATRPEANVQIITRDGSLDTLDEQNHESAMRDMVGARIQVLTTEKPVIFCEDDLSRLVLEDLFGDAVKPVIAHGFRQVRAAIEGNNAWRTIIKGSTPFCGVVDRDARSDDEVEQLAERGVFCFPYFEVDSILVTPEFTKAFFSTVAAENNTDAELESWFFKAAEREQEPSISEALNHLARDRARATYDLSTRTLRLTDDESYKEKCQVRVTQIEEALRQKDRAAILKLYRGKELLSQFIHLAQGKLHVRMSKRAAVNYQSLRKVINVPELLSSIPELRRLKERVGSHFKWGNPRDPAITL
jgi:ABC-type cobalamin/Fe3+-siderophores transport system ATPase subunit